MSTPVSVLHILDDKKYLMASDLNGSLSFFHLNYILQNHIQTFKEKFLESFLNIRISNNPIIEAVQTDNNLLIVQTTEDLMIYDATDILKLVDECRHLRNQYVQFDKAPLQTIKALSKCPFKMHKNDIVMYFNDETSLSGFNLNKMEASIVLNTSKTAVSFDIVDGYAYVIDADHTLYRKNLLKSTKVFVKSLAPLLKELNVDNTIMPLNIYVSGRKPSQLALAYREYIFFVDYDLLVVDEIFESPEIITYMSQRSNGDIVLGLCNYNVIKIDKDFQLKSCIETNNASTFTLVEHEKRNNEDMNLLLVSGSNGIIDVFLDNLYAYSYIKSR